MGKDKKGNFHPRTGKPSGRGHQTEIVVDDKALEEQFELEDKYGIDPDDNVVEGIPVRHPNRNADKDHDRKKTEGMKQDGDKSTRETLTEERSTVMPELIEAPSKEVLEELFSFTGKLCVTAYLPIHRTGAALNEQVDVIQFRNILQQAESTIEANNADTSRDAVTKVLEPGYELLRNDEFWKNQTSPGLAFFMSENFFKFIQLPVATQEQMLINTSFLLGPLVPYITNRKYFYLLMISKKQAKLFRADAFGIRYIPIEEMPNGIEDVVHLEEKGDQELFRTGSSGAGGGANYHGMGSGQPDDKENIAMYLAEVDSTIRKEILHNENVPLLLAGVDYLIPLYKKVTHYNNVWQEALTGSYEHENAQAVHREALEAMDAYFQEDKKKALAEYGDLSATEKTSIKPEEIIPAAYYSRVSTLFVKNGALLWGSFDEANNKLVQHERQNGKDENLTDKAVLKTILNGGAVYVLDESEMPQGSELAAVMRY